MRALPFYGFVLVLGCAEDTLGSTTSDTATSATATATTEMSLSSSGPSGSSESSGSNAPTSSTGAVDTESSDGTTGDVPCRGLGCACTGACDAGLECSAEGFCVPPGMVWVPEGEFLRGCTIDDEPFCDDDEGPMASVFVSAYAIDRTEVTEVAFEVCVQAGNCTAPQCAKGIGEMAYDPINNGDLPVDCVTWDMASAYCTWASKRLPTEAEWEKAARGVDGRRFPWGNSPEPTCEHVIMAENKKGCDVGDRWAVGSKPLGTSPYGAVDMLGSVSEWASDWYAGYDPRALMDPKGPMDGTFRLSRGGSFVSSDASNLRTTFRARVVPEEQGVGRGFRCAWAD